MTISVACPSCERRFQAPPQFEGKRIKCKSCGEIFVISSVGAAAETPVKPAADDALSALAESVRGVESPGRSRIGIDPPAGRRPDTNGDAAAPTGKTALTPNVLTFNYPGAADVDRWLPASLTVLCFLLLADVVVGPDTRDAPWIAVTRFATFTVFYCMVIFPLTFTMIKKAGREAKFAMPPQAQFRCFAAYLPALLLAAWLFSQDNSGFFIPLVGSILGLAVSSGLMYLLFRLREPDIVSYCVQGAGGFFGGLVGSILLALLLNLATQMIVTDNKAQKSVPASPYAGGLAWVVPPLPRQPVEPADNPMMVNGAIPRSGTLPVPSHPVAKQPPAPIAPPSSSSLVDSVESGKIPGIIDGVIEPLSGSSLFAVLRNNANGIGIELWNTVDWQQQPGTLQLPTGAAKKFVISTDGQKLAWIAEFPRLSVQVWSFPDSTVSTAIPLDKSQGLAELIGFVGDDRLLIERGSSRQTASASLAVDNTPAPTPAATVPPDAPDNEPPPDSVFGGFKVNPGQLARQHAADANHAAAVEHPAGATPSAKPVPAEAGSDDAITPAHSMEIIDTTSGRLVCGFDLPALVTDFVNGQSTNGAKANLHLGTNVAISTASHRLVAAATWQDIPTLMQYDLLTGRRLPSIKITEVDPSQAGTLTGLAYSNDGTKLATLFEHNQSALLLGYNAAGGQKIAEHVYPDGPLDGATHSQPESGAIAWLDPAPLWLLYGQGFINSKTGGHVKSADLGLGAVISQRVLDEHRVQLLVVDNGGRQVSVVDLSSSTNDADTKP